MSLQSLIYNLATRWERFYVSQDLKPLFVYGTLKRGYRNHRLLEEQIFVQEAVTQPIYRLYDNGHYPCLVLDQEAGLAIHGELFQVDKKFFRWLDRLEGVPEGLYRRDLILLQDCEIKPEGYLYLRDVSTFRDCGTSWPPLG